MIYYVPFPFRVSFSQPSNPPAEVNEGEARRGVFSQCALIFCGPHCVAPTNTYCCCWYLSAGTLYIEFEDHWHKKYSDSTIKTNWIKRDWLTEMLWVLCGVVLLGCCCYNAKGANALRFVFFVVVAYTIWRADERSIALIYFPANSVYINIYKLTHTLVVK